MSVSEVRGDRRLYRLHVPSSVSVEMVARCIPQLGGARLLVGHEGGYSPNLLLAQSLLAFINHMAHKAEPTVVGQYCEPNLRSHLPARLTGGTRG